MKKNEYALNEVLKLTGLDQTPPYWLLENTATGERWPLTLSGIASGLSATASRLVGDLLMSNPLGVSMTFPLRLQLDEEGSEEWLLPYEPTLTLRCEHIITRRYVNKGKVKGSIKERWSQNDYEVTIDGMLCGTKGEYPTNDVLKLRSHCEGAKLRVWHPLLELMGISRLVVNRWSLPHTEGKAYQRYRLDCSSDDIYKLLLSREDLNT